MIISLAPRNLRLQNDDLDDEGAGSQRQMEDTKEKIDLSIGFISATLS